MARLIDACMHAQCPMTEPCMRYMMHASCKYSTRLSHEINVFETFIIFIYYMKICSHHKQAKHILRSTLYKEIILLKTLCMS